MQTSRFQLGLIATLAVGLGFSLASSNAIGYPTGPTVSYAANPRWSATGTVGHGGVYADVLVVPDDQIAVITGLTSNTGQYLDLYQDETLVLEGNSLASHISHTRLLNQGNGNLPLAPGTTLRVRNTVASGGPHSYYIEGYYAQP